MMAGKARLFDDKESLDDIMEAAHPRAQKQLGRQVFAISIIVVLFIRFLLKFRFVDSKTRCGRRIAWRL